MAPMAEPLKNLPPYVLTNDDHMLIFAFELAFGMDDFLGLADLPILVVITRTCFIKQNNIKIICYFSA